MNRRERRQHARSRGLHTLTVAHEPSAWLRSLATQAYTTLTANGLLRPGGPPISIPINRAVPGSTEDRTCDRCRTYIPPGRLFYPIYFQPMPNLILTGGLCSDCAAAEAPEAVGVTR